MGGWVGAHFSHTPPRLSRFRCVWKAISHTRHRSFRVFGTPRRPSFTHATEVFALSGCVGGHLSHTPSRFSRFRGVSATIFHTRHRGFRVWGAPESAKTSAASLENGRRGAPKARKPRRRPWKMAAETARKRENLGGVPEKSPPRHPESTKTSVASLRNGFRGIPKARKPRRRP